MLGNAEGARSSREEHHARYITQAPPRNPKPKSDIKPNDPPLYVQSTTGLSVTGTGIRIYVVCLFVFRLHKSGFGLNKRKATKKVTMF